MQSFNTVVHKLCGETFGPIMNQYIHNMIRTKDFLATRNKLAFNHHVTAHKCYRFGMDYGLPKLKSVIDLNTQELDTPMLKYNIDEPNEEISSAMCNPLCFLKT